MPQGTRPGVPRAHFDRMLAEGDRSAGCWIWPYATGKHGYGNLTVEGRTVRVHRLAFQRVHGYWPTVGRHDCDTPLCFNPDHIVDGTQADNCMDTVERGRHVPARGDRHGKTKIPDAAIPGILARLAAGTQAKDIAAEWSVSPSRISDIKRGLRKVATS